jgi:predicted Na+-dependent transporter
VSAFFLSLLGPRFWIPAYLSFFLGFALPGPWHEWRFLVPLFLGGILYFSGLKLRLTEVRTALTDPRHLTQVGWITVVKLLVLPLAAWGVTWCLDPQWAPGVLLVCAMPAGLSSIAFTDILKGNQVLAVLVVLATSALCALSVPGLLLAFHAGGSLEMAAVAGRALYIITLLIVPLTLAQLTRALAPAIIARYHHRWSMGAVVCSCLLGMVSVACNRDLWAAWAPHELLWPLALVCVVSSGILAVGWLSQRWLNRRDATAFACGMAYMNNGLSIAFAVRFFHDDPMMVLPSVLMQIPMIGSVALIGRINRSAQDVFADA